MLTKSMQTNCCTIKIKNQKKSVGSDLLIAHLISSFRWHERQGQVILQLSMIARVERPEQQVYHVPAY